MIYLDNAATTRPFDTVIERMERFYREAYYNPSALYAQALAVEKEIAQTRRYLQSVLGGGTVYFTSCATESNTWVYTCGVKNKRGNIVVSAGEHASGYENAQRLASKGTDVRFVKLRSDGRIDEEDLLRKTDENTALVSVIHCSNETGAINDIRALCAAVKKIAPHALFHSDGVQALGKIPVNCNALGVDYYSVSAHKIGGVKGVGALWVRDGVHIAPLLPGGGQEAGVRSGTENVAGIVGFGEALKAFLQTDTRAVQTMYDAAKEVLGGTEGVILHLPEVASPYILSFSARGVKAEILQRMAAQSGVLIGLGSACSSRLRKNRVLSAMGCDTAEIEGSARISFGPHNTYDETVHAAHILSETVRSLRNKTR